MKKTIWLTSLVRSEDAVKKLIAQLKTYGLEVKGHFWEEGLEKMPWMNVREELIKPDVGLWLILATGESILTPAVRYGLSLLNIAVQAQRGLSFPLIILMSQGAPLSPDALPTPLGGADFLSLTDPGMAAKLVAKVHARVKDISSEYRLDLYGNAQIGQWFEVGPRDSSWPGAMFGVVGGEIVFHAVGPKGSLPSQSVLNYPMKGLKLSLGGKEYLAWAVKNDLGPGDSYFVKIKGFPESIVFSPYSAGEEAEVYMVKIN